MYRFTNDLASRADFRARLYFDGELGIPFLAGALWPYVSLQALLLVPPLVLHRRGTLRYAAAVCGVTWVGALIHWLYPAELGWARPTVDTDPGLAMLYSFDQPHNLVPSLHAAYAVLAAGIVGRSWAFVWAAVIALSSLLLHQHHLVDLATGAALGYFAAMLARPASNGDTDSRPGIASPPPRHTTRS